MWLRVALPHPPCRGCQGSLKFPQKLQLCPLFTLRVLLLSYSPAHGFQPDAEPDPSPFTRDGWETRAYWVGPCGTGGSTWELYILFDGRAMTSYFRTQLGRPHTYNLPEPYEWYVRWCFKCRLLDGALKKPDRWASQYMCLSGQNLGTGDWDAHWTPGINKAVKEAPKKTQFYGRPQGPACHCLWLQTLVPKTTMARFNNRRRSGDFKRVRTIASRMALQVITKKQGLECPKQIPYLYGIWKLGDWSFC